MDTSRRNIPKSSIHHGNRETSDFEAEAICAPINQNAVEAAGFNLPKLSAVTPGRGPSSLSTTVFLTLPSFPLGHSKQCSFARATEGTRIDRNKQLKDLRHFQCMLAPKPSPLRPSYQSYHHSLQLLSLCGTAKIVRRRDAEHPPIKATKKNVVLCATPHIATKLT